MRPLLTLLALLTLACGSPTAPVAQQAARRPHLGGAASKLQIAWTCAGTTCTFTDASTVGGNTYWTDWQAVVASDNSTQEMPLVRVRDVNPWTYTFPSVTAQCGFYMASPCHYEIHLIKAGSAKIVQADSVVTPAP